LLGEGRKKKEKRRGGRPGVPTAETKGTNEGQRVLVIQKKNGLDFGGFLKKRKSKQGLGIS